MAACRWGEQSSFPDSTRAVSPSEWPGTRAGEKLRTEGLAASAIQVFLHIERYRSELPQYFPSAWRELMVPTAFTPDLIGEAVRVLKAIYRPGYRYKR